MTIFIEVSGPDIEEGKAPVPALELTRAPDFDDDLPRLRVLLGSSNGLMMSYGVSRIEDTETGFVFFWPALSENTTRVRGDEVKRTLADKFSPIQAGLAFESDVADKAVPAIERWLLGLEEAAGSYGYGDVDSSELPPMICKTKGDEWRSIQYPPMCATFMRVVARVGHGTVAGGTMYDPEDRVAHLVWCPLENDDTTASVKAFRVGVGISVLCNESVTTECLTLVKSAVSAVRDGFGTGSWHKTVRL